MDIPFPCIPSARSAFATVKSPAATSALPASAVPSAVSNADTAVPRASVPPLLRLGRDETGDDLVACLRRRCAAVGAPQLIKVGAAFTHNVSTQEAAVFLRATCLALADDARLGTALAAERDQASTPGPNAPTPALTPLLQEYVESLTGLLRAVADNGTVLSGTYGFTTFAAFCLERIRAAPTHHVAATVVNDCLHWQRGARQAISGNDALMWPVRGEDPLAHVGFAFALHEPTRDAMPVLEELRQFHPWPEPTIPRSR